MNSNAEEQKDIDKVNIKELEQEIMSYEPRKILATGQQEDIRKLAQQEVIKLLKAYGIIE